MPIYEYRCDNCGHEMEALQKLSEAPLTQCPQCNQPALRKKVSAAGFRLKGGGWYETDFKSKGKKNVAGDSKSESSNSGAATSESKSSSSDTSSSSKSASSDASKSSKSSV